jgi:hypothetical protein
MPRDHELVGCVGEPKEPIKKKENKRCLFSPFKGLPMATARRTCHSIHSQARDQNQKKVPEDSQDAVAVNVETENKVHD